MKKRNINNAFFESRNFFPTLKDGIVIIVISLMWFQTSQNLMILRFNRPKFSGYLGTYYFINIEPVRCNHWLQPLLEISGEVVTEARLTVAIALLMTFIIC